MIESITSISVSLMGLLGVLSLLSSSITLNRDSGQKIIATYLAAEGIELVKNRIDTNYARGNSWNQGVELQDGTYEVSYGVSFNIGDLSAPNSMRLLNLDGTTGIYGYGDGSPTLFRRTVRIRNMSAGGQVNEIKVTADVDWLVRGRSQSVNLEDHFFDWR